MIIIGEKINASRKAIAAALEARDEAAIVLAAKEQAAAGANYIDVNGGDPRPGREARNMAWPFPYWLSVIAGSFERPFWGGRLNHRSLIGWRSVISARKKASG